MSDLKSYENILVSGVDYDFSRNPHESIPVRLFADWATLVAEAARVVDPAFEIRPFPEKIEFKTEMIPSDGPYSANENYYTLDYVSFQLTGETYGIKISFENGRWDGNNSVSMETLGLSQSDSSFQENFLVSSHIPKSAVSPLARFYVWHKAEKTSEVVAIFARHREKIESEKGRK